MKVIRNIILILSLLFFTSCGTWVSSSGDYYSRRYYDYNYYNYRYYNPYSPYNPYRYYYQSPRVIITPPRVAPAPRKVIPNTTYPTRRQSRNKN